MERTFIMIKPDGVQRGLIGEIVGRFEQKGLQLVAAKMLQVSMEVAQEHYAEHKERSFFAELVGFITSSPVFAMIWEGPSAIPIARAMMGKTNPVESAPGTIRGDYGVSVGMNIIHGSDSSESAAREIRLWFADSEIASYDHTIAKWI